MITDCAGMVSGGCVDSREDAKSGMGLILMPVGPQCAIQTIGKGTLGYRQLGLTVVGSQPYHGIVQGSQHMWGLAQPCLAVILAQTHIFAVMQPILDTPVT